MGRASLSSEGNALYAGREIIATRENGRVRVIPYRDGDSPVVRKHKAQVIRLLELAGVDLRG